MTYGRSLELHLKYFGLVDDGGKAITFSEWATLAQDRLLAQNRHENSTLANRSYGRPGATSGSRQRRSGGFWLSALKRRSNGVQQRRALFNAEKDAEETKVWFQNLFHEQFPL